MFTGNYLLSWGAEGPRYFSSWKNLLFSTISSLAGAISFSVGIFDTGFSLCFCLLLTTMETSLNYRIFKTYNNAETWSMYILIPKISQLLLELFLKEMKCYVMSFPIPLLLSSAFPRGKLCPAAGVCPSILCLYAGRVKQSLGLLNMASGVSGSLASGTGGLPHTVDITGPVLLRLLFSSIQGRITV